MIVAALALLAAGAAVLAVVWHEQSRGEALARVPVTRFAPVGSALVLFGVGAALSAAGGEALADVVVLLGVVSAALTLVSLVWLPRALRQPRPVDESDITVVGAPGEVTVRVSEDGRARWLRQTPGREAAREVARQVVAGRPDAHAALYETGQDGGATMVEVVTGDDG